jgi:aminotransferase
MTRLGDESGAVNLSQGLPDFDPPDEVLEAAVKAIRSGDNQYTFPFGTPEFRQAVAGKSETYNRIPADPETEVTITCGVSEAIMAAILGLTDPGDEVIIIEPWYENYVPDCLMAGVNPKFVPLSRGDFRLDLEELRAAFGGRTRLIILNTPHNPTGKVFSREELEGIAGLCQEYNTIAVTDEIYEHIYYEGNKHISIGSLPGMRNRTVTISGLGKSYSVTGWRVGWTLAAEPLSAVIRKVHDYLTVCAPSPFQAAGIAALSLPEDYYTDMREQYWRRRKILLDELRSLGVPYSPPQGAYYVMADISGLEWPEDAYRRDRWTSDRAFAEYIAREIGVAVVPGSSFYTTKDRGLREVRFNFAKTENTLREAAARLRKLRKT